MIDRIKGYLADWASELPQDQFVGAFVFGSLVQSRGKHFDAARSNVNLVLLLADGIRVAHSRTLACRSLLEAKMDVEKEFLRRFGREDASKPILSVTLVTPQELAWGVHTGRERTFYSSSIFFDLRDREIKAIGNADISYSLAHIDDALDTLRQVQAYRSKILDVSANGFCAAKSYDGELAIPVEMLRAAARIRFCRGENDRSDWRSDPDRGLTYLLNLVDGITEGTITARLNRRGNSAPVEATTLLLLWEILADDAIKFISDKLDTLPVGLEVRTKQSGSVPPPTIWCHEGYLFAGRYEIGEEIGSGGMSRVFRVRDQRTDRAMALKIVDPIVLEDDTWKERFRNECKAIGRIESEHIVRIFDSGVEKVNGPDSPLLPYLVMEYLDGPDLQDTIDEHPSGLEVPMVIAYLRDVARGLRKIHADGIVHRDLKPANLKLTKRDDGTSCVKILDFGVVKVNPVDRTPQPTEQLLGTPLYMPPEASARGIIDHRADIYALGVIARTMLWGARDRAESASAIGLPDTFDDWYQRITSTSLVSRFNDAMVAIDALEKALTERHRRGCLMGITLSVALVLGSIFLLNGNHSTLETSSIIIDDIQKATFCSHDGSLQATIFIEYTLGNSDAFEWHMHVTIVPCDGGECNGTSHSYMSDRLVSPDEGEIFVDVKSDMFSRFPYPDYEYRVSIQARHLVEPGQEVSVFESSQYVLTDVDDETRCIYK